MDLAALTALAGTLNLSAVNGFDPELGSTFNVLTYTSHTGEFNPVNGSLGNGKQFAVTHGPTAMTVNPVAAAPIPALLDSDGDGLPDAQELLAGTDPHDAASTFRLRATRASGPEVTLAFPTVPGRTYAVECCTDLAKGVWITILEEIPGTGEPLEILDAEAATRGPQCFYRVRVKWTP